MRSNRATLCAALAALALSLGAGPASALLVDGFEGGLPPVVSGPNSIPLGFSTFAGGGTASIITTQAPPATTVPGADPGNTVLKLDVTVQPAGFGGFVHVFGSGGALAPQDWSSYNAITFWLFGNNTGNKLFIDVLDDPIAGATTPSYPFEIWTSEFKDDFAGWRQISIAFSALSWRDIGNGATNDGLGLTSVYGWALGALGGETGLSTTYYVDGAQLVPEPGTLALLGVGLLMMMGAASRRRPGPR